MSNKLGDMSVADLLRTAREELTGLAELAESIADPDGPRRSKEELNLYINAYHGSIAARIAVAEIKIEKGQFP